MGEVAELLRVSPASIYRAVDRGDLAAFRLGPRGAIRVPRSELSPTAMRESQHTLGGRV